MREVLEVDLGIAAVRLRFSCLNGLRGSFMAMGPFVIAV